MDAPPIQYARTEDGVNIAYSEAGSGTPWVFVTAPLASDLTAFWRTGPQRALATRISADYRFVAIATRGAGSSDRDVDDLSPQARVRDIEAVLDAIGADTFILHAPIQSVPSAVLFARAHPSRVILLVLASPYARGRDLYGDDTTIYSGISSLSRADHRLAMRAGVTAQGFSEAHIEQALELALASATPEQYQRFVETHLAVDITDDLGHVSSPTLVFQQAGQATPERLVREVAAAIPGSKLVALPSFDDADLWAETTFNAVGSVLTQQPTYDSQAAKPTGFRTLLFTDLESSTALTQSLGDAKAQEVLDGHDTAVRVALEANGGEEVKHTGDGIFAAFTSAVSAVKAALQIQRDLSGSEVRVRIGLNAGEPIAKDDDYFGSAVQLAARVCDRAEPGQVLVSQVVRDLCRGKTFRFEDQGEATLKGFPEPVRLFVVGEGD